MAHVELIVIGASAGGLDGLLTIVKSLPHSLPASVIVVMHNNTTSNLASILARVSALPVGVPENGDAIAPGRVLVAPPDYHLLVTKGGVVLHRGPRENGFRPAIDPLFRTAAQVYGNRVMGVILSGALDDGTYGMKVIKDGGGVAVVQDPEEASISSMPLSVIENVAVDHVARASDIPDLIVRLTARAGRKGTAMPRRKEPEPQDLSTDTQVEKMNEHFGPAVGHHLPGLWRRVVASARRQPHAVSLPCWPPVFTRGSRVAPARCCRMGAVERGARAGRTGGLSATHGGARRSLGTRGGPRRICGVGPRESRGGGNDSRRAVPAARPRPA